MFSRSIRTGLLAALFALACSSAQAAVTAGISNAPIWHTSTAYTAPAGSARFGSRVNSGPGTIGGTYTSGSAVYIWAALNDGTSASGGNGPQTCGTPGTTTFTESTGLQWKCLGIVDYTRFTDWAFDCPAYPTGVATLFHFHQCARNSAGEVYRADQGTIPSPADGTTAAGSGPSGTSNGQTDGTVTWDYEVTLRYWSGNNGPIPVQYYPSGNVAPIVTKTTTYTGNFFHGGVAQPNYLAGSDGEFLTFILQGHEDCTADQGSSDESCPGFTSYFITIACAPVDCPVSASALWYDETQFVSFRNSAAGGCVASPGTSSGVPSNAGSYVFRGNALSQQDTAVGTNGVAFKSDNGCGIEGNRPDAMYLQNTIIDAFGPVGWYTDASSFGYNSVIIVRSASAGTTGVESSYAVSWENVTIYMPNANASSACIMLHTTNSVNGDPAAATFSNYALNLGNPYWSNIAAFGCAYPVAAGASGMAPDGIRQFGNASSAAAGLAGPSFTGAYDNNPGFTGIDMPGVSGSACGGSCAGLSFASTFTSTSDLRPKSGSPIIGAGGAFSLTPGSPYSTLTNPTDIFGITRSPTYVIGAAQVAPSVVGGGRRLFR